MIRIPQTDPHADYAAHRDEIDAAVARVMEGGRYILGPEVLTFEREFADWIGATESVGVANGTDAIELALRACGVEPGDSVATVSHTAVATAAAVRRCGANPVFVDIDATTYTMTPESLESCLRKAADSGPRIKAVIPVHLYGCPADMPAILDVAGRYGASVVEDCAQSHGAKCAGRMTGTLGALGAFSFYPTKNLAAIGDGGAVVTSDPDLARRVRELRQYGWRERYVSDYEGVNSRLDEIQAAILRVKLRCLDVANQSRCRVAAIYDEGLRDCSLVRPVCPAPRTHVYHQYVVRVDSRDAVRRQMAADGVDTAIHYPVAVHRQPAYVAHGTGSALTVTDSVIPSILSLPMYAQLTDAAARRVVEVLRATVARLEQGGRA